MSFSRPIQWYHSHADPIWPDSTFKRNPRSSSFLISGLHSPLSASANTTRMPTFFLFQISLFLFVFLLSVWRVRPCPERLERGGPCWLLKLRWMGTQRVQMKVVLSWLVSSLGLSCNEIFCSAWLAQYKLFFPHYTLFQFLCPHRPASWAGSRVCVSGLAYFFLVDDRV